MKTDPALSRPLLAMLAVSAVLAACGGSDDDNNAAPAPLPTIACSFDTTVALAFEEQRLTTPLPNTGANVVGTDTTPIADRIVRDTGFDTFTGDFATSLCGSDGTTTITSYQGAVDLVKAKGSALWRGAVDRVQGRRPSPATSKLPIGSESATASISPLSSANPNSPAGKTSHLTSLLALMPFAPRTRFAKMKGGRTIAHPGVVRKNPLLQAD